jgi:vitamin B12 transporter
VQNDLVPYLARLVVWQRLELYVEPQQAPLSLGRASVAASLGHRSSRVADPAGLVVLDDELVTDVELSLQFWRQRLAVRFAIENIFDARRFDAVGFPLPGRSLHAAVELWLW